jgi:hypothetical protein
MAFRCDSGVESIKSEQIWHGYKATTREAAMAAFAKSWRRE